MANKLYNQKTVATNTASVGDKGGTFTYKGFNSKESSKNYKIYDKNTKQKSYKYKYDRYHTLLN